MQDHHHDHSHHHLIISYHFIAFILQYLSFSVSQDLESRPRHHYL